MDPPSNLVSPEGPDETPSNIAEPVATASLEGDADTYATPVEPVVPDYTPKRSLMSRLAIPLLIVIIIAVPSVLVFAIFNRTQRTTPEQQSNYSAQQINLKSLIPTAPATSKDLSGTLTINGQLQVSPTAKPASPTAGQIYYDKANNQLGYYNGKNFVYLQGGGTTTVNNSTVVNNNSSNTNVNNSVITNTVINNYTTSAPPSVLLQGGTPGTVQTGNFNVDGTGTIGVANIGTGNIATGTITTATIDVGNINTGNITNATIGTENVTTSTIGTGTITTATIGAATINTATIDTATINVANITTGNIGVVNTTDVESGGNTFAINQFAALPSGQSTNVGKDDLLSTSDTQYLGYTLTGQKILIGSNGGPLHSISIYLGDNTLVAPTYSIQVGLYSDDGNFPDRPDTLMWGSSSMVASAVTLNSWLTVNIPYTIQLSPFTPYWIGVNVAPASTQISGEWGFNPSKFNTKIRTNQGQQTICKKVQQSAGGLLNNFNQPTPGIAFLSGPDPGPCTLSNGTFSAYLNYTTDPSTGGAGAMFSLSPTGQAAFRSTVDSLNAFKIQNAASATTIFNVDTYNMRIAVGKSSADYTLDVNGDLNLSNNSPLRFGGRASVIGNATTTTIAGSTVAIQGDNLKVQNAAGTTTYLTISGTTGAATFAGAATFSSTATVTGAAALNGATTLAGATTATNTLTSKVTSPTAYTIQNASAANLFVADTTNMAISVTGTDTTFANLTLNNAHFKSTQTTAPTIAAPTNCGAGATSAIIAGSTDTAGSFTITTGTDGTASTCDDTITFRKAYGAAPKLIITVGNNDIPSTQRNIYVASKSTTNFSVKFGNSAAGANSTTYTFSYLVIE